MFINEPEQKGYISYKLEDIKTNKQRFSFILGKAELFDGNKPLCALTEFSIKNKKALVCNTYPITSKFYIHSLDTKEH
jgi:hypothetical protein